MMMVQVLFDMMCFIALASALYVAYTKDLVRSIFMFFVTLFALAGLYVLAMADFVAITQIVIYVGGILVLILFAFMLSARETLLVLQQQKKNAFINFNKLPSLLLAGLFFVVLFNVLQKAQPDKLGWVADAVKYRNVITPGANMTENIGVNLMTRYLLPFEAISILLLMALVGAAHLSRKGGGEA